MNPILSLIGHRQRAPEIRSGSDVLLLDSINVELEIAEVVLTDVELKHLVDHGKQVIQRPNGLKGNGIGRAEDTARGGRDQGVFDDGHRHATIIKNSREETVIATDNASRSWCSSIGIENFTDVMLFSDFHDSVSGVSALGIAQRRPINANGMAVMPDAAQHRLDHMAVAEKAGPFVISEVRGDNGRFSAIALFHEFEEDVGLLRFQI